MVLEFPDIGKVKRQEDLKKCIPVPIGYTDQSKTDYLQRKIALHAWEIKAIFNKKSAEKHYPDQILKNLKVQDGFQIFVEPDYSKISVLLL